MEESERERLEAMLEASRSEVAPTKCARRFRTAPPCRPGAGGGRSWHRGEALEAQGLASQGALLRSSGPAPAPVLGQLGESRLVAAIDTDLAGEQSDSKALDADTKGPLRDNPPARRHRDPVRVLRRADRQGRAPFGTPLRHQRAGARHDHDRQCRLRTRGPLLPRGHNPPEVWNHLGTKILPKLRSGLDLKIGLEFSVTVSADSANGLTTDLRQILQEPDLAEAVKVE
jgi:hypothetical protein